MTKQYLKDGERLRTLYNVEVVAENVSEADLNDLYEQLKVLSTKCALKVKIKEVD